MPSIAPPRVPAGSRFYTAVALGAVIVMIVGFAPTYYLRSAFGGPPLSLLLHIHGLVTTLWFAVFLAQVRLIAARRLVWHRRLGVASMVLAVAVLVLGLATVIAVGRRGFSPDRPPAPHFLAMIFGNLFVFGALVTAGFYFRRRGDVHKRLMTLATLSMLNPAIARIPLPVFQTGGFVTSFLWTDLCVLAVVGYDSLKHRRLHPAFGWGTALILAAQPLRFVVADWPPWHRFVEWLTA
jgi:uncharacterized membrane protein YozB (DUF420 family)